MTVAQPALRPTPAFPIVPLILAGLLGQLAFEIYAWLVSPLVFGPSLQPANLVVALTKMATGVTVSYGLAFVVHTIIGAGFVLLVWAVHKALNLRLAFAGAVAGFILWFVAQGILAPLIGRSFMMDFGTYTQSSFVAHVGMALLMGIAVDALLKRTSQTAPQ